MRNLKKALALVMVFALVLGTVASAASFTDVDSSYSYSEEVELLADLGVLAGFPDGSYQPEATITRVQAAAVIFRILTGRQSAAMYDGATKFYDVAANYWGTGYINYCADIGAIGGYPDGSFKPDQAITVAEYESMLVRALGLTEGKTLSYPNGYLAMADANLINEDVPSIAANAAANRGLVSKLTYNTIMNATYQTLATRDDPSPKIIEKIFKIVPYEGVITATQFAGLAGASTGAVDKFTFDDTLTVGSKDGTYKFAKVTSDMIGQQVKMYLKTNAANDTAVYAVVPSSDNKVVDVSMANYSDANDGKGPYYKVNGVKSYITLPVNANVYVNGTVATAAEYTALTTNSATPNTTDMGKNILKSVRLVSNDGTDKSVEYIFVQTYTYAKYQQTANNKVYTDQAIVNLKASDGTVYDVSISDGLVADDKVLVYKSANGYIGEVVKCDTIEATLDGLSGSGTTDLKYTFNGAAKSAVRASTAPYALTTNSSKLDDSSNLGKAAKFIVAPFFGLVLETSQGTTSVANYYYIKSVAEGSSFDAGKSVVKAVNTKGETVQLTFDNSTIKLNDVSGNTALQTWSATADANNNIQTLKDHVFVLTINSSNEITAIKTPNIADSTVSNYLDNGDYAGLYNIGKSAYSSTTKLLEVAGIAAGTTINHKVDDSSAFFVKDSNNDIYVYIGTFPATVANNMQMVESYSKSDAYNTMRAAVLTAVNKPSASTNVYGMLLDTGAIVADTNGQAYANFKVAMGGEIKTLSTTAVAYTDTAYLTKFASTNAAISKGAVVEFNLTSDGKIALNSSKNAFTKLNTYSDTITGSTFALNQTANIGYVADYSGNLLAITNQGYQNIAASGGNVSTIFKVADDVKIYEVDKNDIGAATISAKGAVQVIKIDNVQRTKVMFVYDLSVNDSALQKIIEIYVIK